MVIGRYIITGLMNAPVNYCQCSPSLEGAIIIGRTESRMALYQMDRQKYRCDMAAEDFAIFCNVFYDWDSYIFGAWIPPLRTTGIV